MSFFDDDNYDNELDADYANPDDDFDEPQDEDDLKLPRLSFDKEEGEEEDDDEFFDEGELTLEEKRLYSSVPKDIEIVVNGKYSYIVVDREIIDAHPDILSINMPILLKWVDSSITYPFLTRFEASALIEKRVEHLSEGEKSTIAVGEDVDSFSIAERELKEGKLPLLIERTRKNGGKRIFYIDPNGKNSKGFTLFRGDYV